MSSQYQECDPFSNEAFDSLRNFIAKYRERGAEADFEEFERELRVRVSACEAELVGEQLRRYDVDCPEILVNGEMFRRKSMNRKSYTCVAGELSLDRHIYVPRGGGRSICPLDLRAGVVESQWTPRAARLMAQAVGNAPPKEAAELFEEIGGMRPSASSLDRLPKRLSERWERDRKTFESELREQEEIASESATVAISIDGVYVPMKPEYASDRRRPEAVKSKGPAGFREVECGVVSLYDEGGKRLGTTRYGRSPERNKVTLKSQVEAELESILNVRPDLRVVAVADGARENWEYFKDLSNSLDIEFDEVVDFFHACERIKTALDAYYGDQSPDASACFEQFKVWLQEANDGADRVIRSLKYRRDQSTGWRRKTIETQLNYFRRYRTRMRYKELLDQNLPIGSGVVEATCKTLASERLKRSGMSWSLAGTQAILTIRSLLQSGRWSRAWDLLAAQYRSQIELKHAS